MWDLLRATHLGPSLVVTVIASALALAAGLGWRAAPLGAAVLAGQFSVGWSNDWLDHDRDRAAGRTDKPLVTGRLRAATLRYAALCALVVAAALSLTVGVAAAGVHLVALAAAWSYNLALKATVASVVPYAVAFGLLPVFVALAAGGRPPAWTVGAGALLGAGAHFTNTLADVDADARTRLRGLPQRVGPAWSVTVAAALLGAGAMVAAVGHVRGGGSVGAGFAVAAGALALVGAAIVAGRRGRGQAAFTLTMAAAVVLVVLLVASGAQLALPLPGR